MAHRNGTGQQGERVGGVLDRIREALRDNLDRCRREAMANAHSSRPLGPVERSECSKGAGQEQPPGLGIFELADASEQRRVEGRAEREGRIGEPTPVERGGQDMADASEQRWADGREDYPSSRSPGRLTGASQQAWPPRPDDLHAWGRLPALAQPSVCRVAHELPRRVDRLRALGNAVVPAVAEVIGRAILAAEHETKEPQR